MNNLDKSKKEVDKKERTVICARCAWQWEPRKESPISCPKCKSYDWEGNKVK